MGTVRWTKGTTEAHVAGTEGVSGCCWLTEVLSTPLKISGGSLGLGSQPGTCSSSSRGPKAATVHLQAFSSSSWSPCPSLGLLSLSQSGSGF